MRKIMTRSKVNILGIEFDNFTQKEFVHQLIADSQHHLNRFVVTANPEIVLTAYHDLNYQQIINHADYVTADGIGIVKGAQILGTPLAERVTGFDTMQALLQYADQNQKKVYFLGGKPEVTTALRSVIKKKYPHLIISGVHNGYFNDAEPIIYEIQQARPDFVFVALGFPKQEFFIAHHRSVSNSIWMGVGGSFDVLTGNVKRASEFWINHHIEWLFRLIQEPTRFKRMLALPRYLLCVYNQKFKQKK